MSSLGNHAANFKMPILQHTFKGERWWKLHEQLPLIHYFSLVEKQALPESRIQVVLHGWDGLQNDAQT